MREIHLNGYIDDDIWFGDEITPGILHDELYPKSDQPADDVRIILNSYGGSCNAATQMYDELSAYPGNVHIIISGTAASAATVMASAADRLEMTPGSLFMIHDPSMGVYGNAADLRDALDMLNVCKESILNIYCQRSFHNRNEVSAMMTATTWMDANAAKEYGFIDGIVTAPADGITPDDVLDHYPVDRMMHDIALALMAVQTQTTNILSDFPTKAAETDIPSPV